MTIDPARGTPSLIDQAMPRPDFTLAEHLVVDAPAGAVYDEIGRFDLGRVSDPVLRVLFWCRALPERLQRLLFPKGSEEMTPAEIAIGTDWVLLGERDGEEIVLGAKGRFWTPVVTWDQIPVDDFERTTPAHHGRIVTSFAVHPYGDRRSVVTYEIRVDLPDTGTRRAFRSYWVTVRPFVGLVGRRILRAIRDAATTIEQ